MSNVIGGTQGTHHAQAVAQQGVGGAQGQFNGQAIAAGPAQPRATSALKTAWLEVQHFFKSLVGMRVSTPQPQQISNGGDATRAVLHAMTKREPDPLDILGSLSQLHTHGQFTQDEARDGLTRESGQLFRQEFGNMSDMQLMRLRTTFQNNPELGEPLTQAGTGAIMAFEGDDEMTVTQQAASGKMNDIGFLALSLRDAVNSELEDRGYKLGPTRETTVGSPLFNHFADRVVANGGDFQAVITEIRNEVAQRQQARADGMMKNLGF